VGVRHISARSPYGVLETRFAGLSSENRWSDPGDPTFYLADSLGTALAEFARHVREHRALALERAAVERDVYRLELSVGAVLDLRDPAVYRELGLLSAPHGFLGRAYARATANFVRRTSSAEALLVPAMAFLDDPDRWVLVLFLEKVPPLESFVRAEQAGTFVVAP
jgi:RES domain-containing protein